MKNNKLWIAFSVIAGVIIIYLLIENNRKEKDKAEKDRKIADLQKEIDENENINEEIKRRLTALVQNDYEIEPHIANELSQIVALLEIKQEPTAVLKLAKIIENLLKRLYKGEPKIKELAKQNNRKTPVFADYLELAKIDKVISMEDWHLLSVMKIIRNEEAHELDVQKERTHILATFISGISTILGLCRKLKRKNIEVEILSNN